MSSSLAIFAPRIGTRSETFIRQHVQLLEANGCPVIAETLSWPDSGHWITSGPTLVLDQTPWKIIRLLRQVPPIQAWWQREAIMRFLRRQETRVILAEYLDSSLSILPIARRMGLRFFAHAHGYDVSAKLRSAYWRERYLAYRDADGLITMSQASRKRLIDLGLEADRIHVIPYGIQVSPSPPSRPARENVQILAVGRLVAKKAPLLTLAAFQKAKIRHNSLHLHLVGTGPLQDAVRRFVHDQALADCVTLHGSQPSERVAQLMAKADLFVQHSVTDPETGDEEGLPVSILEAMGAGLPVVATRHAGIPEAVLEDETGLLVDEGDVSAMAECLVHLARTPSDRQRLGQAAYRRACRLFSWEQERAELRRLLQLD